MSCINRCSIVLCYNWHSHTYRLYAKWRWTARIKHLMIDSTHAQNELEFPQFFLLLFWKISSIYEVNLSIWLLSQSASSRSISHFITTTTNWCVYFFLNTMLYDTILWRSGKKGNMKVFLAHVVKFTTHVLAEVNSLYALLHEKNTKPVISNNSY